MFLFGMDAGEVLNAKDSYHPRSVYERNSELREAIDSIRRGELGNFDWIVNYLLDSDPYMVLADFESYDKAQKRVEIEYQLPHDFTQKSLINIAKSGIFSSDRSVKEYAQNIWHI